MNINFLNKLKENFGKLLYQLFLKQELYFEASYQESYSLTSWLLCSQDIQDSNPPSIVVTIELSITFFEISNK